MLKNLFNRKKPPARHVPLEPPQRYKWLFEQSLSDAQNRYRRHCRINTVKPKHAQTVRQLFEMS